MNNITHLKAFQLKMATPLMAAAGCAGDAAVSTQEALGACLLQIRPRVARGRGAREAPPITLPINTTVFRPPKQKCVVY